VVDSDFSCAQDAIACNPGFHMQKFCAKKSQHILFIQISIQDKNNSQTANQQKFLENIQIVMQQKN
jgi:hypothetical protein